MTLGGEAYSAFGLAINQLVSQLITITCDVLLVTATNWVIAVEQAGANVAQTFDASHGLNTSTYTQISLTTTSTASSWYWEFGKVAWQSPSPQQTTGIVHVRAVSVSVTPPGPRTEIQYDFTVGGGATIAGPLFCQSLTQTSDERVKDCIEDISLSLIHI